MRRFNEGGYLRAADGWRKSKSCHYRPALQRQLRGRVGKIKNDSMANDKFYEFLLATLFQNTEAVMADDASIY